MIATRTLAIITLELEEAREDVALLQRITGAEDRIKRLIPELEKAKAAHDKAEAAKIAAVAEMHRIAHEARFAGLRDLTITETPDAKSSSVLSSTFNITYTRDAWNADANATLPQSVSVTGFAALPHNVLAWIVQRHPEKLPASIMALAPDIDEALACYFGGLNRGYLTA